MGTTDDIVRNLIVNAERKVKQNKPITKTELNYLLAVNYGIDNELCKKAEELVIK